MSADTLPFDAEQDDSSLEQRFVRFHRKNPQVYRAFCRFADEALRAGRTRIGAKLIFERIRWYTTVEGGRARGRRFQAQQQLPRVLRADVAQRASGA